MKKHRYRGTLTFDFGSSIDRNELQRMEAALVRQGWRYVETTAFVYDQRAEESELDALTHIWQGIAIVGRASAPVGGVVSAVSFVIQRIDAQKEKQRAFGGQRAANARDYRQDTFPGDEQPGVAP